MDRQRGARIAWVVSVALLVSIPFSPGRATAAQETPGTPLNCGAEEATEPCGVFGTRLELSRPSELATTSLFPYLGRVLPNLEPPPGPNGFAGSPEPGIELVVKAGRTIRVALGERVRLRKVGQELTGTLVESVYSYDRVVLPAGTRVHGHIAKLAGVSAGARIRAILGGDFTPLKRAELEFDWLELPDGTRLATQTRASDGSEGVTLQVATSGGNGKVARAKEALSQKVQTAIAPFKGPGKMERLKEYLVGRLPFHPQYLARGTLYSVELLSALDFGAATPTARAAPGDLAPPDSVLEARLETALDSGKTPRSAAIEAILTRPLFSTDERLILPEGSRLVGEVTLATPARRLHRNGQLRFLFETVQPPEEESRALLASLYAAELPQADQLSIDEEGGTRASDSKTRFIAPALAVLATTSSFDRDNDALPPGVGGAPHGHYGSRGVAGYFGLGLVGSALSLAARPAATALGVLGVVRTVYRTVLGKGREVVIPADTPVQLQMSPQATAH